MTVKGCVPSECCVCFRERSDSDMLRQIMERCDDVTNGSPIRGT